MMAKLRCDDVTDGLRASEGVATFVDVEGRRHFIRVERDFLYREGQFWYLPVAIVHVNLNSRLVLLELPHEAETGANRVWVDQDQLADPVEAYTSARR